MNIIKNRKWFYLFSGILVLLSIIALFSFGLQLGVDFKGGAIMEISYATSTPTKSMIEESWAKADITASVRATGDTGYIVRSRAITEPERVSIVQELAYGKADNLTVKRFDSIGPLLGAETARKSMVSIVLVLVVIILFIAFVFRHVSKPISSWKYGFVAVLALAHDVIIPTGAFAVLGKLMGYEVDTLFVTALLVVLGFSVHDTIVVFDRVREHLKNDTKQKLPFETLVGESVSETFTRSINTSLTTLIALVILYFLGGSATEHFALVMIIGIAVGTYSSIFLASPLLVTLEKIQNKSKV